MVDGKEGAMTHESGQVEEAVVRADEVEQGKIFPAPEDRGYKVSIFGTGSNKTPTDSRVIDMAGDLSRILIESGNHVATGGYNVGIMKAVHAEAAETAERLGIAGREGLNTAYPLSEKIKWPVPDRAEVDRSESLSLRLSKLIDSSDAFVVFSGTMGTETELLSTVNSQMLEMAKEGAQIKPVIVIDPTSELSFFLADRAKKDPKFSQSSVAEHVYLVSSPEEANEIVDIYYLMNAGKEVEPERLEKIKPESFKSFFSSLGTFEDGGGI